VEAEAAPSAALDAAARVVPSPTRAAPAAPAAVGSSPRTVDSGRGADPELAAAGLPGHSPSTAAVVASAGEDTGAGVCGRRKPHGTGNAENGNNQLRLFDDGGGGGGGSAADGQAAGLPENIGGCGDGGDGGGSGGGGVGGAVLWDDDYRALRARLEVPSLGFGSLRTLGQPAGWAGGGACLAKASGGASRMSSPSGWRSMVFASFVLWVQFR